MGAFLGFALKMGLCLYKSMSEKPKPQKKRVNDGQVFLIMANAIAIAILVKIFFEFYGLSSEGYDYYFTAASSAQMMAYVIMWPVLFFDVVAIIIGFVKKWNLAANIITVILTLLLFGCYVCDYDVLTREKRELERARDESGHYARSISTYKMYCEDPDFQYHYDKTKSQRLLKGYVKYVCQNEGAHPSSVDDIMSNVIASQDFDGSNIVYYPLNLRDGAASANHEDYGSPKNNNEYLIFESIGCRFEEKPKENIASVWYINDKGKLACSELQDKRYYSESRPL